jgi:hypothetical protein
MVAHARLTILRKLSAVGARPFSCQHTVTTVFAPATGLNVTRPQRNFRTHPGASETPIPASTSEITVCHCVASAAMFGAKPERAH